MSGTFVLPVWPGRSWWRFLKGARLIRAYPKGAKLFTSPGLARFDVGGGRIPFPRCSRMARADPVACDCGPFSPRSRGGCRVPGGEEANVDRGP
eukprot:762932-Prorocentrum_minimum.AAC.1